MRNVKFVDLEAIIDFLYCGETNVFQQNLDSFLALAEDLQLKGLMGGQADNHQEIDNSSVSRQIKREPKTLQSSKASYKSKENGLVGVLKLKTRAPTFFALSSYVNIDGVFHLSHK